MSSPATNPLNVFHVVSMELGRIAGPFVEHADAERVCRALNFPFGGDYYIQFEEVL